MFKILCLLLDTQVGEDLILPDQVDSTQAAPGAGLYQPQEFRIPVGPIFNFVTGKYVISFFKTEHELPVHCKSWLETRMWNGSKNLKKISMV